MQNYRKLSVWRKAHAIALNLHQLSARIPRTGNLGLINQINRAALSIPANIAEGSSRPTDKDFIKFLYISFASATEVEYHLEFARDLGVISGQEFALRAAEITEIRKMITGLVKYLRQADR